MSHITHPVNSAEFYQSLPRKRMAAGVLILDDARRILLVKPSYRDHWEIPGGIVEADEGPHQAALREVAEETTLVVHLGGLLCLDYCDARDQITESLQFIFAAMASHGTPQVDGVEIVECGFFAIDEAVLHLRATLAKRVAAAFDALTTGRTAYLHNGENPFGNLG